MPRLFGKVEPSLARRDANARREANSRKEAAVRREASWRKQQQHQHTFQQHNQTQERAPRRSFAFMKYSSDRRSTVSVSRSREHTRQIAMKLSSELASPTADFNPSQGSESAPSVPSSSHTKVPAPGPAPSALDNHLAKHNPPLDRNSFDSNSVNSLSSGAYDMDVIESSHRNTASVASGKSRNRAIPPRRSSKEGSNASSLDHFMERRSSVDRALATRLASPQTQNHAPRPNGERTVNSMRTLPSNSSMQSSFPHTAARGTGGAAARRRMRSQLKQSTIETTSEASSYEALEDMTPPQSPHSLKRFNSSNSLGSNRSGRGANHVANYTYRMPRPPLATASQHGSTNSSQQAGSACGSSTSSADCLFDSNNVDGGFTFDAFGLDANQVEREVNEAMQELAGSHPDLSMFLDRNDEEFPPQQWDSPGGQSSASPAEDADGFVDGFRVASTSLPLHIRHSPTSSEKSSLTSTSTDVHNQSDGRVNVFKEKAGFFRSSGAPRRRFTQQQPPAEEPSDVGEPVYDGRRDSKNYPKPLTMPALSDPNEPDTTPSEIGSGNLSAAFASESGVPSSAGCPSDVCVASDHEDNTDGMVVSSDDDEALVRAPRSSVSSGNNREGPVSESDRDSEEKKDEDASSESVGDLKAVWERLGAVHGRKKVEQLRARQQALTQQRQQRIEKDEPLSTGKVGSNVLDYAARLRRRHTISDNDSAGGVEKDIPQREETKQEELKKRDGPRAVTGNNDKAEERRTGALFGDPLKPAKLEHRKEANGVSSANGVYEKVDRFRLARRHSTSDYDTPRKEPNHHEDHRSPNYSATAPLEQKLQNRRIAGGRYAPGSSSPTGYLSETERASESSMILPTTSKPQPRAVTSTNPDQRPTECMDQRTSISSYKQRLRPTHRDLGTKSEGGAAVRHSEVNVILNRLRGVIVNEDKQDTHESHSDLGATPSFLAGVKLRRTVTPSKHVGDMRGETVRDVVPGDREPVDSNTENAQDDYQNQETNQNQNIDERTSNGSADTKHHGDMPVKRLTYRERRGIETKRPLHTDHFRQAHNDDHSAYHQEARLVNDVAPRGLEEERQQEEHSLNRPTYREGLELGFIRRAEVGTVDQAQDDADSQDVQQQRNLDDITPSSSTEVSQREEVPIKRMTYRERRELELKRKQEQEEMQNKNGPPQRDVASLIRRRIAANRKNAMASKQDGPKDPQNGVAAYRTLLKPVRKESPSPAKNSVDIETNRGALSDDQGLRDAVIDRVPLSDTQEKLDSAQTIGQGTHHIRNSEEGSSHIEPAVDKRNSHEDTEKRQTSLRLGNEISHHATPRQSGNSNSENAIKNDEKDRGVSTKKCDSEEHRQSSALESEEDREDRHIVDDDFRQRHLQFPADGRAGEGPEPVAASKKIDKNVFSGHSGAPVHEIKQQPERSGSLNADANGGFDHSSEILREDLATKPRTAALLKSVAEGKFSIRKGDGQDSASAVQQLNNDVLDRTSSVGKSSDRSSKMTRSGSLNADANVGFDYSSEILREDLATKPRTAALLKSVAEGKFSIGYGDGQDSASEAQHLKNDDVLNRTSSAGKSSDRSSKMAELSKYLVQESQTRDLAERGSTRDNAKSQTARTPISSPSSDQRSGHADSPSRTPTATKVLLNAFLAGKGTATASSPHRGDVDSLEQSSGDRKRDKGEAHSESSMSGPPALKDDPKYERYFRMLRVGMPLEVVKHAMIRDGVDPSVMDGDHNKPVGIPLRADPQYAKYFQMLKVGLQLDAVKHAMERDGVDSSVMDQDHDLPAKTRRIPDQDDEPKERDTHRRARLHWNTLQKVRSNSLWAKIDNDPELEQIDIDEKEFQELFLAELNPVASPSRLGANRKRGAGVRVVDSKRANNGGIILARLKLSHDDLADAVDRIDENAMTAEQIENIVEFLPTKEERRALEAYMLEGGRDAAEKFDGLCECEKFMVSMMTVKHAKRKIRALLFKVQFENCLESLQNEANLVDQACDELSNSVRLRHLLGIVLNFGNRLNTAGSKRRRKAGAFTLDSLLKLNQAKAFDKKTTFLHYVVLIVQRNNELLLRFKDDLATVLKADKVYWDQCLADLEEVENQLENVRRIALYQARIVLAYRVSKKNQRDEDGTESLSEVSMSLEEEVEALRATPIGLFTLSAIKSVAALRDRVENTKDKFARLLEYFGEEDTSMQPHELFSIVVSFCRDFDKAKEQVVENVKKKQREERKRQANTRPPPHSKKHGVRNEMLRVSQHQPNIATVFKQSKRAQSNVSTVGASLRDEVEEDQKAASSDEVVSHVESHSSFANRTSSPAGSLNRTTIESPIQQKVSYCPPTDGSLGGSETETKSDVPPVLGSAPSSPIPSKPLNAELTSLSLATQSSENDSSISHAAVVERQPPTAPSTYMSSTFDSTESVLVDDIPPGMQEGGRFEKIRDSRPLQNGVSSSSMGNKNGESNRSSNATSKYMRQKARLMRRQRMMRNSSPVHITSSGSAGSSEPGQTEATAPETISESISGSQSATSDGKHQMSPRSNIRYQRRIEQRRRLSSTGYRASASGP